MLNPDFIIDDITKKTAQDAFDAMMSQFGKLCTLWLPSTQTECPNCWYDKTNNRSTNRYKPGGPVSFTVGICPHCKGAGKLVAESTVQVKLIIFDMKSRDFNKMAKNFTDLRIDNGVLITKGYYADYPKIIKAEKMRVDSNTDSYNTTLLPLKKYEYKLAAPPMDINSLIQGRYFICGWEQLQS